MDARIKVKTKAVTTTELLIGAIILMFASAAVILLLRPLPDLTVESLSLSPSGGSFAIRNAGTANFSGSLQVVYQWLRPNGTVSSSEGLYSMTTIAAGGIDGRTIGSAFITGAPSDAVKLRVTVDQVNSFAESNERNNSAVANKPLPDLTIDPPTLTTSGGTYTIRNTGTADYSGSLGFTLQWVRSDGALISAGTSAGYFTVTLGAGGADTRTITSLFVAGAPPDAVKLRITVDQANSIFESNETNNSVEVSRP